MIKYQSAWVSEQGFANVGLYVYGTKNEIRAICESYIGNANAEVTMQSDHRTIENAKKNAERLCRRDRRMSPDHELCIIDVLPAGEVLR